MVADGRASKGNVFTEMVADGRASEGNVFTKKVMDGKASQCDLFAERAKGPRWDWVSPGNQGGEFKSDAMRKNQDQGGTEREFMVHDSPPQNGVAEKGMRTRAE